MADPPRRPWPSSAENREHSRFAMVGFLFDMILAAAALRDSRASFAIIGLVVWVVVYWQDRLSDGSGRFRRADCNSECSVLRIYSADEEGEKINQ
jgi:hypothetical protein